MTDFLTLYQEVQDSIGRDSTSDTFAISIAKRGVNVALFAAALLFEPPELRTEEDLTALSTQDYVAISGLTRSYRIESVYNETGSNHVYPIPYKMRDIYYLPTSGNVLFWSVYGNTLFYNPTPSSSETLNISHLQYPAALSSDGDAFPFPTLEGYVLSMATEYAWAALEEDESAQIWNRVSEKLSLPEGLGRKIRQLIAREVPTDGDNL